MPGCRLALMIVIYMISRMTLITDIQRDVSGCYVCDLHNDFDSCNVSDVHKNLDVKNVLMV
jgi:hypothetical protein